MYCNYCAKLVEGKEIFCSEEHKQMFAEAKKNGTAVPLQIKPGLLITSKAYDKIPLIIEKYLKNEEDISNGFAQHQRYVAPKGKVKKNTPEEPLF